MSRHCGTSFSPFLHYLLDSGNKYKYSLIVVGYSFKIIHLGVLLGEKCVFQCWDKTEENFRKPLVCINILLECWYHLISPRIVGELKNPQQIANPPHDSFLHKKTSFGHVACWTWIIPKYISLAGVMNSL